jgi:hypothetical protein
MKSFELTRARGKRMRYRVLNADELIGGWLTVDGAVAQVRRLIEQRLVNLLKPGMTSNALFRAYASTSAFVIEPVGDQAPALFDVNSYALGRAMYLAPAEPLPAGGLSAQPNSPMLEVSSPRRVSRGTLREAFAIGWALGEAQNAQSPELSIASSEADLDETLDPSVTKQVN